MSYTCQSCYAASFILCSGNTSISAGLDPATVYYIWIEDKFGNFYLQQVTTDGSGSFEIDFTVFPEGLFTQYAGYFTLTVSASSAFSTDETLTINGTDYNCIVFDFVKQTIV